MVLTFLGNVSAFAGTVTLDGSTVIMLRGFVKYMSAWSESSGLVITHGGSAAGSESQSSGSQQGGGSTSSGSASGYGQGHPSSNNTSTQSNPAGNGAASPSGAQGTNSSQQNDQSSGSSSSDKLNYTTKIWARIMFRVFNREIGTMGMIMMDSWPFNEFRLKRALIRQYLSDDLYITVGKTRSLINIRAFSFSNRIFKPYLVGFQGEEWTTQAVLTYFKDMGNSSLVLSMGVEDRDPFIIGTNGHGRDTVNSYVTDVRRKWPAPVGQVRYNFRLAPGRPSVLMVFGELMPAYFTVENVTEVVNGNNTHGGPHGGGNRAYGGGTSTSGSAGAGGGHGSSGTTTKITYDELGRLAFIYGALARVNLRRITFVAEYLHSRGMMSFAGVGGNSLRTFSYVYHDGKLIQRESDVLGVQAIVTPIRRLRLAGGYVYFNVSNWNYSDDYFLKNEVKRVKTFFLMGTFNIYGNFNLFAQWTHMKTRYAIDEGEFTSRTGREWTVGIRYRFFF